MVLPVLAVATSDYSGFSPLTLGFALGAYGFTQALLQIPLGVSVGQDRPTSGY